MRRLECFHNGIILIVICRKISDTNLNNIFTTAKQLKLFNIMKKILGLDLGTNSIGWAVLGTDENGTPVHIEGVGSRIIPMGSDKIDYEKGTTILLL